MQQPQGGRIVTTYIGTLDERDTSEKECWCLTCRSRDGSLEIEDILRVIGSRRALGYGVCGREECGANEIHYSKGGIHNQIRAQVTDSELRQRDVSRKDCRQWVYESYDVRGVLVALRHV